MSRPLMCDDCGCPIEKPFISAQSANINLKVIGRLDLCPDCVLVRVRRVMGLEIEEEDIEAGETYGIPV